MTITIDEGIDDGSSNPYKVRGGLFDFIGAHTYTTPLVAFREGISNGYDAYDDKRLPVEQRKTEKQKELWVTIDSLRKRVTWTDKATGIIVDLEEFKVFGSEEIEGVSLAKQLSDDVGQFHMGKGTYRNASLTRTAKIYSNNDEEGYILTMLPVGWSKEDVIFPKELRHKALPHVGLKVEIFDAKEDLLNFNKVCRELRKWFGILIARGVKIWIKDMTIPNAEYLKLAPPTDLKTNHEVQSDPMLKMKSGKYISARLEHVHKRSPMGETIDVYVKYVYIKSIHTEYLVKGWVNCDDLQLSASRDTFKMSDDSTWPEFNVCLEKYLIKENYEKVTDKSTDRIKNKRKIEDIASAIFEKILELYPEEGLDLGGKPAKKDIKGNPPGVDKPDIFIDQETRDKGDTTGTIEPVGTDRKRKPKKTRKRKSKDKDSISPKIKLLSHSFPEMPTMFMKDSKILWINLARPAAVKIFYNVPDKQFWKVYAPSIVKAVINWRTRNEKDISIATWNDMYENSLNSIFSGG